VWSVVGPGTGSRLFDQCLVNLDAGLPKLHHESMLTTTTTHQSAARLTTGGHQPQQRLGTQLRAEWLITLFAVDSE